MLINLRQASRLPQVSDTPVAVLNRMLAAGRPDSVRRRTVVA